MCQFTACIDDGACKTKVTGGCLASPEQQSVAIYFKIFGSPPYSSVSPPGGIPFNRAVQLTAVSAAAAAAPNSFGCRFMSSKRQYADTSEGIREAYADVPCKVVDCSQSDLETFAEVCDFVEEVGAKKAEKLGLEGMRALLEMVSDHRVQADILF